MSRQPRGLVLHVRGAGEVMTARTIWAQAVGGLLLSVAVGTTAWGMDVGDVKQEWTASGKKLAQERTKLPAHDDMVLIPAGEFLMGSDKKVDHAAYLPEMPQRKVHLDAYEIDKYEVTTVQYLRYVLAHDMPPQVDWKFDGGNFQDTMSNHPIMHVNWMQADAYCKWVGKRLPTEAEWEKASRGEDGRIYPWGNQPAGLSRANFGRGGLSGPVRDRPERLLLYPPIISVDKYDNAVSPYGLFQMVGNVAEWVADWYDKDYYKTAPNRNPKGPEKGTQKAFRGGGWIDSTPSVRTTQRNGTEPTTSMNWLGFRCARDAGETSVSVEKADAAPPASTTVQ